MKYTFIICSLVSFLIVLTLNPCLCEEPAPAPAPAPAKPESPAPNSDVPKPDDKSPCCVTTNCELIDPAATTPITDPTQSKICSTFVDYVYLKGEACADQENKFKITCCPKIKDPNAPAEPAAPAEPTTPNP